MPLDTSQPVDEEFAAAFGQSLGGLLDVGKWPEGGDLAALYPRLRDQVSESALMQQRSRKPIRDTIFPRLRSVYRITAEQVRDIQTGLLFNGGAECCDGTVQHHDSLVLGVTQIGFSLVRYQGSHGRWVQRLYRRDLTERFADPAAEALALLKRRSQRESDIEESRDRLARLARRGLMDYAERAALCRLSTAVWKIGQGYPVPDSLLMPTSPELVREGIAVMRDLLLRHRKFVFVASETADRLALHIGDALEPGEFAILCTLEKDLSDTKLQHLAASRYGHREETRLIEEFVREARSQLVKGVYRAAEHAPPHVFYAHAEHDSEAGALAIADSVLQPLRGFPMLIDLADLVCRHAFDGASFQGTLRNAYAATGEPTRFLGERETRS